jgi:Tat protein secretion system quality control protein TatD with DNase activity
VIDTHCHLGDPAFAADRDDVVARMRGAGVHRALVGSR